MTRKLAHQVSQTRCKDDRARQWLKNGGIAREDSDDELGLEDHPWEWIYSRSPPATPLKDGKDSSSLDIVGARMGDFECTIGDCVLLKAEGNKEAWVGLICGFVEEDADADEYEDEQSDSGYDEGSGKGMAANFMWFSTEREIRNAKKRRDDALPNEVYITPSWDINPLASINGKANVMSQQAFLKKFPSGKISKSSKESGKTFVCRRGCNTRTATYTDEFIWEDLFRGTEDLPGLIERVKSQTKATRKKRKRDEYEDEGEEYKYQPDAHEPRTPKKRRKTDAPMTPVSKPKRPAGTPTTGSQKRVVMKKPLTITPLTTRFLSPSHTNSTPHQQARTNLHVSSVPQSLPCRDSEFSTVYSHLENAITAGTGSCIYISGTPGTGKTATVREVVSTLHGAVQAEELDDFIFVEINGMKVTEPTQAYSLLWEALRGDRVSPSHALGLLEHEFAHPSPRRVPCVVLMDELDQLVTRTQSVMYNFFNWPSLRHSRLIVLAVANTMDLPERTLSNKISSRLGLTRVLFPGYTHEQLMAIIRSRLESLAGQVMDKDAIQFAARKVAAVSGDARRCLDICRRAVEMAEVEARDNEVIAMTPSKRQKKREEQDQLAQKRGSDGLVTIQTIKAAIREATSSPQQQYLKNLPLNAKVFLAALLARTRRTGVNECVLLDVVEEARRLALIAADNPQVQELLLKVDPRRKTQRGESVSRRPMQPTMASQVRRIGHAGVELEEAGVIGIEGGRARSERSGRIRLAIADEEVSTALRGDVEVRGFGFS